MRIAAPPRVARTVVLDIDLSSDVGDVGGLAVACAYHRLGYTRIVGIVQSVTNPYSPGAAEALVRFHGITGLTHGAYKPSGGGSFDPNGPGTFAQHIYDNYDHSGVGLSSTVDDAVDVYEALLTAHPGLTIYAGGPLTTIDALLTAHPALVAANVAELVVVAGLWPNSAAVVTGVTGNPEWNLVQAKSEAARVFANWPSPVTIVGCELGDQFKVGAGISSVLGATDPRRKAYELANYHVAGREGWDELGHLVLAEGDDWFGKVRGTGTINTVDGSNTWVTDAGGNHEHLTLRAGLAHYKTHLNAVLMSGWPDI